ncbi:phage tail protein, partial [Vibrio fluvialis]|nr:phage tail protein [Vibrio fluvialis]
MSLLITHAGIAAAIRAGDLGIEYKITHISIGSAG